MPLHLQVRRSLRSAIEDHFEDGQDFWTEAALIERVGVSRGTVRQALLELSREGLLVRQAAKGSFVRKSAATTLGVFVPRYDSDFFTGMLDHLAQAGRGCRLRLQVYHTHQGENAEESWRHLTQSP